MNGAHVKRSIRLPRDLARRLADHAGARQASQTAIIEAALETWLSPDGADRLEAALGRRLDRITTQLQRLAWNVELSNETLAQFIRFWLTTNPPLPEDALRAARAQGRERWLHFVDALARRMEQGPRLGSELGPLLERSAEQP